MLYVCYVVQAVTAWEALACVHSCAEALLSSAAKDEDSRPGVRVCLPASVSSENLMQSFAVNPSLLSSSRVLHGHSAEMRTLGGEYAEHLRLPLGHEPAAALPGEYRVRVLLLVEHIFFVPTVLNELPFHFSYCHLMCS